MVIIDFLLSFKGTNDQLQHYSQTRSKAMKEADLCNIQPLNHFYCRSRQIGSINRSRRGFFNVKISGYLKLLPHYWHYCLFIGQNRCRVIQQSCRRHVTSSKTSHIYGYSGMLIIILILHDTAGFAVEGKYRLLRQGVSNFLCGESFCSTKRSICILLVVFVIPARRYNNEALPPGSWTEKRMLINVSPSAEKPLRAFISLRGRRIRLV